MRASSVFRRTGTPHFALIFCMIFHRLWLLLFVASLLFVGTLGAQDDSGNAAPSGNGNAGGGQNGTPSTGNGTGNGTNNGTNGTNNGTNGTNNGTNGTNNGTNGTNNGANSGTSSGASSSFGTLPAAGTIPAQGNIPAQGVQGTGINPPPGQAPNLNAPNAFGQGAASTLPSGTDQNTQENAAGTSASAFGNTQGQAGAQLRAAPPSFSIPGFYGRGPINFTAGEGRLARPHFRFSASVSEGYDDNPLQTPTHGFATREQQVPVQVAAAVPATTGLQVVPSGDPNIPDSLQTVIIPGVGAKFKNVTVPAIKAPVRIGSLVERVNADMDVQFANRHSLFTLDLTGGASYYQDRQGSNTDYNLNLALLYLRKLSGRAQFTINVTESYQTEPDYSQPNLPTSSNLGPYISSNIKLDLSYRWTPRISSVTSLTYSSLNYIDSGPSVQNYATTTLGTEIRYLFSPRNTLVGEVRYSADAHSNDSTLDTKNYYILVGDDITLSRRFLATFRFGEEIESFKQGGSQAAPFLETTLDYRIGQATVLRWNVRYGYEEAGVADQHNLTARTGLTLTQVFSPRVQGTFSLNLVRGSLSSNDGSSSTTSTTSTSTVVNPFALPADQITDTINGTAAIYYTLNRHWSFNLTYSYTQSIGPVSFDDFYRNQVFLGATYQF